jgi:hypothetical protein
MKISHGCHTHAMQSVAGGAEGAEDSEVTKVRIVS